MTRLISKKDIEKEMKRSRKLMIRGLYFTGGVLLVSIFLRELLVASTFCFLLAISHQIEYRYWCLRLNNSGKK